MKTKLYVMTIVLSVLLIGCGNISDEEEERVIKIIEESEVGRKYIDDDSLVDSSLLKGEFDKELGVIEYTFSAWVNEDFYELSTEEKKYILSEFGKQIPFGNQSCSGNRSCRITAVSLDFYDSEIGIEEYTYFIESNAYYIDDEFIFD